MTLTAAAATLQVPPDCVSTQLALEPIVGVGDGVGVGVGEGVGVGVGVGIDVADGCAVGVALAMLGTALPPPPPPQPAIASVSKRTATTIRTLHTKNRKPGHRYRAGLKSTSAHVY